MSFKAASARSLSSKPRKVFALNSISSTADLGVDKFSTVVPSSVSTIFGFCPLGDIASVLASTVSGSRSFLNLLAIALPPLEAA